MKTAGRFRIRPLDLILMARNDRGYSYPPTVMLTDLLHWPTRWSPTR
jgi:hypothetical protein